MRLLRLAIETQKWELAAHVLILGAIKARQSEHDKPGSPMTFVMFLEETGGSGQLGRECDGNGQEILLQNGALALTLRVGWPA